METLQMREQQQPINICACMSLISDFAQKHLAFVGLSPGSVSSDASLQTKSKVHGVQKHSARAVENKAGVSFRIAPSRARASRPRSSVSSTAMMPAAPLRRTPEGGADKNVEKIGCRRSNSAPQLDTELLKQVSSRKVESKGTRYFTELGEKYIKSRISLPATQSR